MSEMKKKGNERFKEEGLAMSVSAEFKQYKNEE